MSKASKVWLIVAAALVLLGIVMFAASMTANSWDFNKLTTSEYKTNTYPINDEFSKIVIDADTNDVSVLPSDDGTCKVVCCESSVIRHSIILQDQTLSIGIIKDSNWFSYINITTGAPSIILYLPEKKYESLSITESTGKVTAGSVDFGGDVQIDVTTGDVELNDICCGNLSSRGSTGSITLTDVVASGTLSIIRDTGDVNFKDCDGGELSVRTSTGNVSGSLLSDKIFETQTATGDISVPGSASGGKCKIVTSTGDITISIN